eukprot:10916176-Lingulodinium_polyedra.AAC.1
MERQVVEKSEPGSCPPGRRSGETPNSAQSDMRPITSTLSSAAKPDLSSASTTTCPRKSTRVSFPTGLTSSCT